LDRRLLGFLVLFIAACGGGGGGGGGPTPPTEPAPTVNLSADLTSQLINEDITLTWSSTNATSCNASGDWSGIKALSGSETVSISKSGANTYTLSCSGAGGSRSSTTTVEGYRQSNGVVVDGYISGAEIFIDENNNFALDANENNTTSDNNGAFTLRYTDGNLVSIGGTDLDSQVLLDNFLLNHKLTGHSDFKVITPITTVASFMENGSNVNSALNIDSSIDIKTTDPVANIGDDGIYDYLYEKGNQLTVLAYALQNITNELKTTTETTKDFFNAIAQEIETEYNSTALKVNIEEKAFIQKVLENIIENKSLEITEDSKTNTIEALTGVMPVIEVKSTNDLTTSVIRFAVSTLQNDVISIANGTASSDLINSYTKDILTYISQDQNIDSKDIAPNINALDDTAITTEDNSVTIDVLINDSYVTTAPYSISVTSPSNGSTTIAESLPEKITYTPNADFNGQDEFNYTITQGEKTSTALVSVTIKEENDAPTININSIIEVTEGNTFVANIDIDDPDDDELTLTLSGTDANSFNLSSENVLTFKEAPDYDVKNSYAITLNLTDGMETVSKSVTINILDVNEEPVIVNLNSTLEIDENLLNIVQVNATDKEDDLICYFVNGQDKAFFEISSGGLLSFKQAPDYEEPKDNGGDNKYDISI